MSGGSSDDETTRNRLVLAAVKAFSSSGYEGASVREIERKAGVNRGLVAYHFGSKEALWKEAVAWLMARFHDEFERYRSILPDLSSIERQRVLFTVYGRFSARYPEYFRLLMLEGQTESDRARWLVDEHIRPAVEFFNRVGGRPPLSETTELDAIAYFLFIGAAASIFAIPALSRLLYGVDPADAAVSERAVRAIGALGLGTADVAAHPPPTPSLPAGRTPRGRR